MKVLVTGAAGRMGSETVRQLHAAGHEVVAVDVRPGEALPVELHEVNLLDVPAVAARVEGMDAVVHLGNYIGVGSPGERPYAQTFNENVAMNMNVFQAAIDHGVKRVVFASTVQVFASESQGFPYPSYAFKTAYLPLDSQCPPNPGNSYALSKSIGETMLQQYVVPHGLVGVALRLPRLCGREKLSALRPIAPDIAQRKPSRITQGFSILSFSDAAHAAIASLTADLTGYHCFFPALSQVFGPAVTDAIAKYYPGVPLKRPIEQMDSLIDFSDFTRATGWRPLDVFEG